jgi:hypothetical protein
MRYTGWRRLSGDTADHPELLDIGKKLLGQLDNQRRLSGVKTLAIEHTTPDGDVVRARFDYDIPSIEVLAAGKGGSQPEVRSTAGFIARPQMQGVLPAGHPEIVLMPARHATLYFDKALAPTTPDGLVQGGYAKLFPTGLPEYGNVDWRSKDESIVLSWVGPTARYFGTSIAYTYVYRNGQILLDMLDVSLDLLGFVGGAVVGACVRGQWLYVMAIHTPDPDILDHFLIRFPIQRDPFNPASPPAPTLAQEPRWKLGQGQLLHTRHEDATQYSLEAHHWMFNQSGTEARRITQKNEQSCEQVMSYVEDVDGVPQWAYSEVLHPNLTTISNVISNLHETYGGSSLPDAFLILAATRQLDETQRNSAAQASGGGGLPR